MHLLLAVLICTIKQSCSGLATSTELSAVCYAALHIQLQRRPRPVLGLGLCSVQEPQRQHNSGAGDCWDDTDAPAPRPQHELTAQPTAHHGGQQYLAADRSAAGMAANTPRMQLHALEHGGGALPGPRQQAEAEQRSAAGIDPRTAQTDAAQGMWQPADHDPRDGAHMRHNNGRLRPDAADERSALGHLSGQHHWQQRGGTAVDRDQRWPAAAYARGGALRDWDDLYAPGAGMQHESGQWGGDPLEHGRGWQHTGSDGMAYRLPRADWMGHGGEYMDTGRWRQAPSDRHEEACHPDDTWLEQTTRCASWELPPSDPALQRGHGPRDTQRGAPLPDGSAHHCGAMMPPHGLQPRGLADRQQGFAQDGRALPIDGRRGYAAAGWPHSGGMSVPDGGRLGSDGGWDIGVDSRYGSGRNHSASADWPAGYGAAPAYRRSRGDVARDAASRDGVDEFGVRDAADLFALGTQAQEPSPDLRWGTST